MRSVGLADERNIGRPTGFFGRLLKTQINGARPDGLCNVTLPGAWVTVISVRGLLRFVFTPLEADGVREETCSV